MLSPTLSPTKSDTDFIVCTDVTNAVLNQTGNITTSALVPDSGVGNVVYRATMMLGISVVSATGNVQGTLTWTDPCTAAGIQTTANIILTSIGRTTTGVTFVCAPNTAINYSTAVTSGDGNQRYNSIVTIERVNTNG